MATDLDYQQVIKKAFDEALEALKVTDATNPIQSQYDEIAVTYPDAVTVVYTYLLDGDTVKVVTLVYTDATQDFLESVTFA